MQGHLKSFDTGNSQALCRMSNEKLSRDESDLSQYLTARPRDSPSKALLNNLDQIGKSGERIENNPLVLNHLAAHLRPRCTTRYNRSTIMAMPWPPPIQAVANP